MLILKNAPEGLKGRMSLWMFEVGAGIFVCDGNRKLREWIWNCVTDNIDEGSATMIWSTNREEFGFDILSCGNPEYVPEDVDGIKLIKIYR